MKPQYLIQLVTKGDKQYRLVHVQDFDELKTFLTHVNDELYIVGDITATEIFPEWKEFTKIDTKLEHGGTND